MTKKKTQVAIFNSHAEFLDALGEALDREGVPTVTALLAEIQRRAGSRRLPGKA